jgi:hypothetical protein
MLADEDPGAPGPRGRMADRALPLGGDGSPATAPAT